MTNVDAVCLDKADFFVENDETKNCQWIGLRKKRIKLNCKRKNVRKNCAASCGLCNADYTSLPANLDAVCLDKADFFVEGNEARNCKWIGSRKKRKKLNCKRKNVRKNCAVSCGICSKDDQSPPESYCVGSFTHLQRNNSFSTPTHEYHWLYAPKLLIGIIIPNL